MWEKFISKYFVRLIWINALLFGLLHLTAFTELSIELFLLVLQLFVLRSLCLRLSRAATPALG